MELLKIEDSMLEELYSWRQDKFAVRYNPFAPCDFTLFKKKIFDYSSDIIDLNKGIACKWVIVDDGELLSILGVSVVNVRMGTAEVGYQVNPKFRKQGIGSKVLQLLVDEVFAKTELRKLIATIAIGNVPSCKIVEKVGFVKEGLLRKHFIINNIPTDQLFYGILKEDYLDRSK